MLKQQNRMHIQYAKATNPRTRTDGYNLVENNPVVTVGCLEKCSSVTCCLSLVPIIVLSITMLIILVAFFVPQGNFEKSSTEFRRIHTPLCLKNAAKCNLRLVESLPEGLNYSANDPKFMSTFDAWNSLLDLANDSLYIGSFYWTLRGADVVNHSSAALGEAIFDRLLSNSDNKKLKIRIAQSAPTAMEPNIDTKILAEKQAAVVRSVDFPRLVGGGVLHTKLWIVDNQHFYLGSANMDWRSLTQVKELGVLAENCACLTQDVLKIFEAYWYLGKNDSVVPNQWPQEFATKFNLNSPMFVDFNNKFSMSAFFSSSPPPLSGMGRTEDIDAIVSTILTAKKYVYVAVMDYFPLMIYTKKIHYWPYIDDALRKAAVENNVTVKLLISWWEHSKPSEDYFLRSLTSLSNAMDSINIEIRRFIVPANDDQKTIPFSRVNHNKYMVTDNTAYIGTSNWSGDYFTNTAGIGLVLSVANKKTNTIENLPQETDVTTIRDELSSLFLRDWNSPYAIDLQ